MTTGKGSVKFEEGFESIECGDEFISVERSGFLRRMDGLFEKLLSLLLLLLASPLFMILPLLIRLQDGGPAFYRGERLGKGKKPFDMYKFRTLVPDAESRLGGELLNHGHNLKTPLGSFLRDVRLDELPQLFNVLRGDMRFFGPRPERRAVYEEQCQHIPGYDQRFTVKPGVIGYSQVFTPHSTPKRLRASIDNNYTRRQKGIFADLGMVIFTLMFLGLDMLNKSARLVVERSLLLMRLGKVRERRGADRVRPKGSVVSLYQGEKGVYSGRIKLVDINEGHIQVRVERPLDDTPLFLRFQISSGSRWFDSGKNKAASCTAAISHVRNLPSVDGLAYSYVLKYSPVSELNRYLIDKYLIGSSVL